MLIPTEPIHRYLLCQRLLCVVKQQHKSLSKFFDQDVKNIEINLNNMNFI